MKSSLQTHLVPQRQMHFSLALRQAVEILEMPQQELSLFLQKEVENNPLLELTEPQGGKSIQDFPHIPSLYERLQGEIKEFFLDPLDQKIAEIIVASLDEKGFLTTPLEEIALLASTSIEKIESILKTIQSFDPPGIGAKNLQESLLIQLQRKQKKHSLAYEIIDHHFEDLLHGRYCRIKKQKKIDAEHFTHAIQELAGLNLRPAELFQIAPTAIAIPDLKASFLDQTWYVECADEEFFQISLREDLSIIVAKLAKEEKKTIRQWMISAKWLLRALQRRKKLLISLSSFILKKQAENRSQTISAQDLAEELGVHESTIHRALAGKFIEGPWGIVPLKSLLCQTSHTHLHKSELLKLIEQENKEKPFTDEELSHLLSQKGIHLARRTISKYRKELKLLSASRRKNCKASSLKNST